MSDRSFVNSIEETRLMWCEHCNAAEDTARLWKLKCREKRHKFSLKLPREQHKSLNNLIDKWTGVEDE